MKKSLALRRVARLLVLLASTSLVRAQTATETTLRAETKAAIARDSTIGEDPTARRAALDALGGRAGAVVVMNAKTGRVYTIVNQDWAVRRGFKPCSLIKLVTGLAGLNEKVIDPTKAMKVSGPAETLTFERALAASHNGYFEDVGARLGFAKMLRYARDLGLGQRTGLNLRGETAGRLPQSAAAQDLREMSSHGDNFLVTPVQWATLMSSIANGGALLRPRVTSAATGATIRRRLGLVSARALQQLRPGLVETVQYGTARVAYSSGLRIAGKTGTCEGQGSELGLFASYAPAAAPRVTVVVGTRGPDATGGSAAAIAAQVHRALKIR